MSVLGVILVRIFPHLDWIRRDTEYLSVSPYSVQMRENTDQKKLRIRTLFMQCTTFYDETFSFNNSINPYIAMSSNGQTYFKNLTAFAERFLKCVWPFMTLRSKGLILPSHYVSVNSSLWTTFLFFFLWHFY